ncbi:hypothetical protein L9F63_002438 [Diploptera punctata]|uniref:lysozyme n=1 Tax=Diploptera punctata TaxID=6984 RepID=A0AAD7ZTV2_DIPPU|nr:hypothetical protein L9F63_002438 [Diploptera punctata]
MEFFKYVLILLSAACAWGKVYERCELARELRDVHKLPEDQIPTWVCIARHESEFNTSAVGHLAGDGSGDHGLFQISDIYWCSPPGKGWACGVTCAELEDDDIEDDVACIKRIFREHQRLSQNGFNAWVVYGQHCSNSESVKEYVEGCFDNNVNNKTTTTSSTTPVLTTTSKKPWKVIKEPKSSNEVMKGAGKKSIWWT